MKIATGIAAIILGWFMMGYGFATPGLRHPDSTNIFLGGLAIMFGSIAYLVFLALKKR